MADEIVVALVGIVGVSMGSIFTLILARLNYVYKIKENKINNAHQQRNVYLENARLKCETVYIPLQKAITNMRIAYEKFKYPVLSVSIKTSEMIGDKKELIEGITNNVKIINDLFTSGNEAYLTTELSEYVRSFIVFINCSILSSYPNEVLALGLEIKNLPIPDNLRSEMYRQETKPHIWDFFRNIELKLSIPESNMSISISPNFEFKKKELVISAPLESEEFEKRFINDSVIIGELIKEVTLGSKKDSYTEKR